jgi:hypothetical protein
MFAKATEATEIAEITEGKAIRAEFSRIPLCTLCPLWQMSFSFLFAKSKAIRSFLNCFT